MKEQVYVNESSPKRQVIFTFPTFLYIFKKKKSGNVWRSGYVPDREVLELRTGHLSAAGA